MERYYYDVIRKGEVFTYSFELLSAEEEEESLNKVREDLAALKDLIGEKEFDKFWSDEDEKRTFESCNGDVLKYIDKLLNPYMTTKVRDSSGNVVWVSPYI